MVFDARTSSMLRLSVRAWRMRVIIFKKSVKLRALDRVVCRKAWAAWAIKFAHAALFLISLLTWEWMVEATLYDSLSSSGVYCEVSIPGVAFGMETIAYVDFSRFSEQSLPFLADFPAFFPRKKIHVYAWLYLNQTLNNNF